MTVSQDIIPLTIGIKNIRINYVLIKEDLFKESPMEVEMAVTQTTTFKSINESGIFLISMSFRYVETRQEIFVISVVNEFFLGGLGKLTLDDKMFTMPFDTLIACLSMSLSHTRAFIPQLISNTVFKDQIALPIFNPLKITQELYPDFMAQKSTQEVLQKKRPAKRITK